MCLEINVALLTWNYYAPNKPTIEKRVITKSTLPFCADIQIIMTSGVDFQHTKGKKNTVSTAIVSDAKTGKRCNKETEKN